MHQFTGTGPDASSQTDGTVLALSHGRTWRLEEEADLALVATKH